MKYFGRTLVLLIATAVVSCSDTENSENQEQPEVTQQESFKPNEQQIGIEKYMSEVDNNEEFRVFSSLDYMNSERDLKVHAFKDTTDTSFVKIIEYVTDLSTNAPERRSFYMKNGKKVASRELFEEGEGEQRHYVERITYYGNDEQALVTKIRTARYEEDLELAPFEVTETFDAQMDRPLRALNQEGEFAPRFESFLENAGDLYIVVGENKPDGYTSALLLQSRNGLLDKMYKNPDKYRGKLLSLAFTKERSPDGNYQLLLGATLIEE